MYTFQFKAQYGRITADSTFRTVTNLFAEDAMNGNEGLGTALPTTQDQTDQKVDGSKETTDEDQKSSAAKRIRCAPSSDNYSGETAEAVMIAHSIRQ